MKNSNDTMNRNRDLPACSVVPQPAALTRAPNVGVVSKLRPITDSFHNLAIHYSLVILSLHITRSGTMTASTKRARINK